MVEYGLPPGPPAPAQARALVQPVVEPLSSEVAANVLLMTSELVTNAVRHGEAEASEGIVLRIDRRDDSVRVEVVNEGTAFVPDPQEPDRDQGGGFGLYLIEQLATEWGVVAEGSQTKVWFEVAA